MVNVYYAGTIVEAGTLNEFQQLNTQEVAIYRNVDTHKIEVEVVCPLEVEYYGDYNVIIAPLEIGVKGLQEQADLEIAAIERGLDM